MGYTIQPQWQKQFVKDLWALIFFTVHEKFNIKSVLLFIFTCFNWQEKCACTRKIRKFNLMSLYGNFVETHSFRIVEFWVIHLKLSRNRGFPQNFHSRSLGEAQCFMQGHLPPDICILSTFWKQRTTILSSWPALYALPINPKTLPYCRNCIFCTLTTKSLDQSRSRKRFS